MKNKRFQKLYSQGTMEVFEIWLDTETGIQYLFHRSGYSGGLTPLLNADGKPATVPTSQHSQKENL